MAKTRNDIVSNGSSTIYDVTFDLGFIKKEHIYVYAEGSNYTVQLAYNWISDTRIELVAPVPAGDTFHIRRVVPRDQLTNDYEDGAILREDNLDSSFLQALMVLEELSDGYFLVDGSEFSVENDINLDGQKLVGSDIINAIQVFYERNGGTLAVDNVQAAIDALDSYRVSMQGNLTSNNASISTLTSDLDAAEVQIQANLDNIDQFRLDIAANALDISALNTNKMDRDVDAVSGNVAVFNSAGHAIDSDTSIDDIINSAPTYSQETVPTGVIPENAIWYNPSIPAYFIYYVDGDSSQWIEIGQSIQSEVVPDPSLYTTTLDIVNSSVAYPVGTVITTTGYSANGDGGAGLWELTNIVDSPSKEPYELGEPSLRDASGRTWVLVGQTVNVLSIGATADDTGFNNKLVLFAGIQAANSGYTKLDLQGLNFYTQDFVAATLQDKFEIANGSITYNGLTHVQYVLRLKTISDLIVKDLEVNASSLAAKALLINPNNAACKIDVIRCDIGNTLQTDTVTGFAACVQVSPESGVGDYFESCNVIGGKYYNSTSTKTNTGKLTSVGRGVYVSDCEYSTVSEVRVEDIGPYYDGDGVVVTAEGSVVGRRASFKARVGNCYFKDCQKRAVKLQVARATVSNIEVERTQAFTKADGQSEVGMLEGGVVTDVHCTYANGAEPTNIVSFIVNNPDTYTGVPCSVDNITVSSENPLGIVEDIVGFALYASDTTLVGCRMSNINLSCKVRNIARVYTANQASNTRHFAPLLIKDVNFEGWAGTAEDGVLFMTRGASSYNGVDLNAQHVVARDKTVAPLSHLSSLPGSTAFLSVTTIYAEAIAVSDPRFIEKYGGGARVITYPVTEGSTIDIRFTLKSAYSAVLVTVMFTSSRDDDFNKLHTGGVIQASISRAYYAETVAGIKSSAQTGSIAITPSGTSREFNVTKSAGSTNSSGYITVVITDNGDAEQA
ncbi:MAG: putative tail fiber protein [Prokaryotic dsDNA virus sp.]|nr:MAG: putative tail fiber protein [Prokaryotic dsDNA virus sp.]|tara:strand:- start:43148 stop:46012 length:2865 start_codon:yes stop_codon:yes gene_type:complete